MKIGFIFYRNSSSEMLQAKLRCPDIPHLDPINLVKQPPNHLLLPKNLKKIGRISRCPPLHTGSLSDRGAI